MYRTVRNGGSPNERQSDANAGAILRRSGEIVGESPFRTRKGSLVDVRKEELDHAKDEDTQGNSQAVQDHREGEAAPAKDSTQPPSPQEIKEGPALV